MGRVTWLTFHSALINRSTKVRFDDKQASCKGRQPENSVKKCPKKLSEKLSEKNVRQNCPKKSVLYKQYYLGIGYVVPSETVLFKNSFTFRKIAEKGGTPEVLRDEK